MEQAQRDDEVLQLLIIPGAASTFEACHSIRPEAAGATGQRQASASAGAPCTPCPRLSSWAASPVPGDESQRSWPEPRRRHLGPCRHLGRTGALGPCLACLRRVSQRAGAGAGNDPLAPTRQLWAQLWGASQVTSTSRARALSATWPGPDRGRAGRPGRA